MKFQEYKSFEYQEKIDILWEIARNAEPLDLKEWGFNRLPEMEQVIEKISAACSECENVIVIIDELGKPIGVTGVRNVTKPDEEQEGMLWSFYRKLDFNQAKDTIKTFHTVIKMVSSRYAMVYNKILKDNTFFTGLLAKMGAEIHDLPGESSQYNLFILHVEDI